MCKKLLASLLALALVMSPSWAQTGDAIPCKGIGYQNPFGMRGDAGLGAARASETLRGLLVPSGVDTGVIYPMTNIAAVRGNRNACLLYGNAVFGAALGESYEPLVVTKDSIQIGILVLWNPTDAPSGGIVKFEALSGKDKEQLLSDLKKMKVTGMAGGITSAGALGSGLIEPRLFAGIPPKVGGIGQAELLRATAMNWTAPEAVVGRYNNLTKASLNGLLAVKDPRVLRSQLVLIPLPREAPGYGLYVKKNTPTEVRERLLKIFLAIRNPSKELKEALDVDDTPEFVPVGPEKGREVMSFVDAYLRYSK
jgi:hypothetical protein